MEFRIEFVILNKNHVTKLSVNINKIATIRNARGGQTPNVVQFAIDCQTFGADGITVHPRPDERHITYKDTLEISEIISTEFNIEGFPDARYFDLLKKNCILILNLYICAYFKFFNIIKNNNYEK